MRERVIQAVRAQGLDVRVQTLEGLTRTVEEAAGAVGCEMAQIAKSIVFIADGEPIVCVCSGSHQVEPRKVCEALDCAEARPATADEVRASTGFAVGGVPPLGHGLPVVFDDALLRYERIWAAGGDGHTLFAVEPERLAGCTDAIVVALASG